MEHYLARFKNRTFGEWPFQRTYDSAEHTGAFANNLLRLPASPPAFPLTVPGRWNKPGTEKQEIYDRIVNGHWNIP